MWLLNTSTMELQEFSGLSIPSYAILSHTWGPPDEEVSFRDIRKDHGAAKWKPGYDKVKSCCVKAAEDKHLWVWIDSCCIDKRSSAELSEAINSMYKWYQNAQLCYVYMADVPSSDFDESPDKTTDGFSRSRWFTRGWTLQELIAPRKIKFFGQDWTLLGTKGVRIASSQAVSENISSDEPFLLKLAKITGIEKRVLNDPSVLRYTSVSQRMSWAARRETAREEDIAYSLMGLFGVHLPILYGEGQQVAFRRLQLEIIKSSPDQTIFAWKADKESSGLLADSPANFADSGAFYAYNPWATTFREHSMTNIGLSINLGLHHRHDAAGADLVLAALRCWVGPRKNPQRIRIYLKPVLRKFSAASVLSIYRRERCHELECASRLSTLGKRQDIYVLEDEQFDHVKLIDGDLDEMYLGFE